MKRTISLSIALFTMCFTFAQTQTKRESLAKWQLGNKEVEKITSITNEDTLVYYSFVFRNAKYTHITDYKSVVFNDLNELKAFVETADSLLTNVKLEKDESLRYPIGNVKYITLQLYLKTPSLLIEDNNRLGYCYLAKIDLKKMKEIFSEQ